MEYEILNSKISAPATDGTIKRKRFNPIFSSILKNKITIVTAGAGYGKSIAISQACEHLGCDNSWYRLELNDVEPLTFIRYIIAGIKKPYPDFGERTLKVLNSSTTITKINQTILTILINEIQDTLKNNFIIVLDDCHEVSDSEEITTLLQFFIDHLPEGVYIVMISRIDSSLFLSKYRARMEINEILQEDLAFNIEEISALYGHLFGFLIPQQSVYNLYKFSEGWVSGLILFYHLSKGKNMDEIEELFLSIKINHKIFREYMEENVYEPLSQEIKHFLLYTSIFKRIEIELCNSFLKITNSGAILEELEKKRLFTSSLEDGNIYRYHNIFKDFLSNKLELEKGYSTLCETHYNAAILFEKMGRVEQALHHYLQAEKYDDVFRLLQKLGYKLFHKGKRQIIDVFLKKIPEKILNNEPWPMVLKAKLYLSKGQLGKAVRYCNMAYEIFLERNINEGVEISLMVLGRAYYLIGDFCKAEEIFIRVLNSDYLNDYSYFEISGNLIFTSAFVGDFKKSDHYFEEAVLKLEEMKKSENYLAVKIWIYINYGFRWYFFGDFAKSNIYADLVYEDIELLNSTPAKAFYFHLKSLNYLFLGNIEKAYKSTNKGLNEISGKGFYGAQEAWLNMNFAAIFMSDGNYNAAQLHIDKAIKIFKSGGSKWGETTMILLLIWLNAKTGQTEKAGKFVAEGLGVIKEIKIPRVQGKLYLFAAFDMLLKQDYKQADIFFKRSEKILSFSLFERCLLFNMRARFYFEQGMEDQAFDSLIQAIKIGQKSLYGSWIFFVVNNETSLFVKIYSLGKFKRYLLAYFSDFWENVSKDLYLLEKSKNKKIKMAASEIIMQMPEDLIPALGVCCFGKFRVFTGNHEIENSEWKSKKAREIFKYLVLSRHKGAVSKDVLLELIWPEQNYEKTLKRLHVALPALRKTLEPNMKKGESSYLIRENDHYRIDFGKGGFVDVDIFIKEIELAEKEKYIKKKLDHLLKAESYYPGDFLKEDLYAEWCFEERESLRREYINVLDNILAIYESVKDTENVIKYAEKYLEIDPYSEEKYQKLMGYFFESGNYSMGIKTYEKCYTKIVEDLDCPLNDDTIILYEKLIKTKKNINTPYDCKVNNKR